MAVTELSSLRLWMFLMGAPGEQGTTFYFLSLFAI